jgi:translation initiation factor eIF-2B subunit gamma
MSLIVSTSGNPDWITPPPYKKADAGSPEHRGMVGDFAEVSRWKQEIVCTSIVAKSTTEGGICARANTLGSYLDTNLRLAKGSGVTTVKTGTPRQSSMTEVSAKTQIGGDSLVGDGTRIGDRCSVKRSVIGPHCTIGKNVKISDSVVMEHCTIEDK